MNRYTKEINLQKAILISLREQRPLLEMTNVGKVPIG